MKPELLAPAGSFECLEAVIEAGCDAVYLGGKSFSARSFATNFSNDEIVKAINYAHLYGVKVYVTVNTLIYENEVDEFIEYVDFLHKNNVDAILIQDIGMLHLVRTIFPNLEVHASTQMHIHNIESAKLMRKIGVKRVVLARETPLDLVKKIKETNIEVETFIHGALCVSYSGQCLMSSILGNRSGNRGSCVGCCRLKYDLKINNEIVSKDKYILSMKDLCTIKDIGKLIDSKIDSLKIEGRTKRPEYSYIVTKLYRKAIDNYIRYKDTKINESDMKDLLEVFNRDFTKGYILNDNNLINNFRPNHMGITVGKVIYSDGKTVKIKLIDNLNRLDGIRIINKDDIGLTITSMKVNGKKKDNAFKNNIIEIKLDKKVSLDSVVVKTTNYKRIQQISIEMHNKTRKIKIKCIGQMRLKDKIYLCFTDGVNTVSVKSDYIIESSINNSLNIDEVKNRINKLGNTIYVIDDFDLSIDDNIFIPNKVLNDLKRELIEKLNEKRIYHTKYKRCDYFFKKIDTEKSKNINCMINDINIYEKIKNYDINNIIVGKDLFNIITDKRKLLKLNNVITSNEYFDNSLVSELGGLNNNYEKCTNYTLNIVNSYSVYFMHLLGAKRVCLSLELTDEQIEEIIKKYKERYQTTPNLELMFYGRELLMTIKSDILLNHSKGYLIDKFNNRFPIVKEDDLIKIYNYKNRDLGDYKKYFDMGINNIRHDILTVEDLKKEQLLEVVR